MTNLEKYYYLQEKLGEDYNVWCYQPGIGEIPVFDSNILRFPLPDDVINNLDSGPKKLSYGKKSPIKKEEELSIKKKELSKL